jgi:fibronectin type 3 domain-containing protein
MLHNKIAKAIISVTAALLIFGGVTFSQSQSSPPSNLKARVEGNSVKLMWEAPEGASDVSYNIYKAPAPSISSAVDPTKLKFAKINTTKEISFEDKIQSTEAGGVQIYYVVAVGSDGKESAGSNYVNVKVGQSETDQDKDKY